MKELDILQAVRHRLGIERLNDMQNQVYGAWKSGAGDLVLYSPTGTGKTLAFALCLLQALQPPLGKLQAVLLAPSRELVVQTTGILRSLATGYKVTSCYGGHAVADEKASLAVTPDIIVATPGRLLDHCKRGNIDLRGTRWLVLDEMDKSLELGFEDDMRRLMRFMPRIKRRVLASATVLDEVPDYVRLSTPITINVLDAGETPVNRIKVWRVHSHDKDKLNALRDLLLSLDGKKTIVFANYREGVDRIYRFLTDNHFDATPYHGAMEQNDREQAVAMLNNGSVTTLVSTDIASRGLDIDAVQHIIHYHMPVSEQVYVHRNGRTARVDATGDAYVITGPDERLPEWVVISEEYIPQPATQACVATMATIYFAAGKKEKLSRGDIMGFIANHGGLEANDIGRIDVFDHYALAAVPAVIATQVVKRLQTAKIKGKKVRMSIKSPARRTGK